MHRFVKNMRKNPRPHSLAQEIKHLMQRWRRGHDDNDLENLKLAVYRHTLPMLRHHLIYSRSFPTDHESLDAWKKNLTKIIAAFEDYILEQTKWNSWRARHKLPFPKQSGSKPTQTELEHNRHIHELIQKIHAHRKIGEHLFFTQMEILGD